MLLAALLMSLGACAPKPASAAQTLMLAVAGSFDRAADLRQRLPDRLRKLTVWRSAPPLPAREVRVTYDTDQRAQSWRLDVLKGPALKSLAGSGALKALGQAGGHTVYAVTGGPFAGALALSGAGGFTLLSRPYVLHYESALLSWLEAAPAP